MVFRKLFLSSMLAVECAVHRIVVRASFYAVARYAIMN